MFAYFRSRPLESRNVELAKMYFECTREYTITVVSKKPFQSDYVARDWELEVIEDFKAALEILFREGA